jgi:hypothetical protein
MDLALDPNIRISRDRQCFGYHLFSFIKTTGDAQKGTEFAKPQDVLCGIILAVQTAMKKLDIGVQMIPV